MAETDHENPEERRDTNRWLATLATFDKDRADRLVALAFLAFFAVLLAITPTYDRQAQLFPLLVGGLGLLLSLLLLLTQFGYVERVRTRSFETARSDLDEVVTARRRATSMALWVLFLLALLTVIGFEIGSLVFLLLSYRYVAGAGWLRTVAYSLAIWGPTIFIFGYLLNIRFPVGILGSLL